jgi:hypothetical protein
MINSGFELLGIPAGLLFITVVIGALFWSIH